MSWYKKSVLDVNSKRKRVVIKSFNAYMGGGNDVSEGALQAVESVNCDCREGSLADAGIGIKVCMDGVGRRMIAPTGGAEIKRIYPVYVKSGNDYTQTLSLVDSNGKVYIYKESAGVFAEKAGLAADTIAVSVMNGDLEAQTVFMGDGGAIVYDAAGSRFIGDEKVTNAGCVCGNRLFMVEPPFSVVYSAPLEPEKLTDTVDDSGVIRFPSESGRIIALAALAEYVYIIYERGVSRLKTAGSARDFQMEALRYGGGTIVDGSVTACGGAVVFLAEDGAYRAKGTRIERAWEKILILPLRGGQVCDHAVLEGQYLLRYIDENGRRRTVALDPDGKNGFYIFDTPALSGGVGKAYGCFDGVICQVVKGGGLPNGVARRFVSERTEFGIVGRKLLRKLDFKGKGEFSLEVDDGKRVKSVSARFVDGRASVDVFLRGEAFSLTFYLSEGAKITEVVAETEYLARGKKDRR